MHKGRAHPSLNEWLHLILNYDRATIYLIARYRLENGYRLPLSL